MWDVHDHRHWHGIYKTPQYHYCQYGHTKWTCHLSKQIVGALVIVTGTHVKCEWVSHTWMVQSNCMGCWFSCRKCERKCKEKIIDFLAVKNMTNTQQTVFSLVWMSYVSDVLFSGLACWGWEPSLGGGGRGEFACLTFLSLRYLVLKTLESGCGQECDYSRKRCLVWFSHKHRFPGVVSLIVLCSLFLYLLSLMWKQTVKAACHTLITNLMIAKGKIVWFLNNQHRKWELQDKFRFCTAEHKTCLAKVNLNKLLSYSLTGTYKHNTAMVLCFYLEMAVCTDSTSLSYATITQNSVRLCTTTASGRILEWKNQKKKAWAPLAHFYRKLLQMNFCYFNVMNAKWGTFFSLSAASVFLSWNHAF